jgi:hypothetical protein
MEIAPTNAYNQDDVTGFDLSGDTARLWLQPQPAHLTRRATASKVSPDEMVV